MTLAIATEPPQQPSQALSSCAKKKGKVVASPPMYSSKSAYSIGFMILNLSKFLRNISPVALSLREILKLNVLGF